MAQNTTYKTRQALLSKAVLKKEQASIMVVDDDSLVLDFLQEYLKRGDYRITVASSGEDALVALAKTSPDIVLVDLKMNGIDGLETIEKIGQ